MNPAWIEKTGKVVVAAIGTAFVAVARKLVQSLKKIRRNLFEEIASKRQS